MTFIIDEAPFVIFIQIDLEFSKHGISLSMKNIVYIDIVKIYFLYTLNDFQLYCRSNEWITHWEEWISSTFCSLPL